MNSLREHELSEREREKKKSGFMLGRHALHRDRDSLLKTSPMKLQDKPVPKKVFCFFP
jgi:hypothetical protein